MRTILFCLLCLLFFTKAGFAQKEDALTGLVNTEKAFAARALESNTRQAFLDFIDTAGVVFNEGKIQNGMKFWKASAISKGKLLWHPVFAGIAASGDIGFTTGPWIYKRSAANDTVLASGFYATIWHLTKEKEWKFLADMGIDCGADLYGHEEIKKWTGGIIVNKENDVLQTEKEFISTYEKTGNAAFKKVVDKNSWFNVDGSLPFTSGDEIISRGVLKIPPGLKFIPKTGEISSSGDFGFVYGLIQYNGKEGNYMRVWKLAKEGARILLQVVNTN